MRKIRKVVIRWECGVCREKYLNAKDAAQCEKRNLEEKRFAIGNRVQGVEKRICTKSWMNYTVVGKVTAVQGPKPSDYDYELRHLGGNNIRLKSHVFVYIVDFPCPQCEEKKQHRFYAPEIIKLSETRNIKIKKKGDK